MLKNESGAVWSGVALMAGLCVGGVHAETLQNSIQWGPAAAKFNVDSGDVSGPPGSTPPGVKADVKDKTVWAFVYDRHIEGPWSFTFQGGLPPVLKLKAAGSASAMGEIGSARAWFPSAMGTYTWQPNSSWALHAGAGLHYTFFTDGSANATYNGAFGGTSSRVRFSSSFGPVVKVGGALSLDQNWFIDLSYSRYWIRSTGTVTTATPGLGDVERKVKVRTSPDVLALTVGYRF